MRSLFGSVLFLFSITLFGQNLDYKYSADIDSMVFFDTSLYKYQFAAVDYSFIAEYKKAIETPDKQFTNPVAVLPTPEQKTFFDSYHPVNARQYILQQAAKTRIMIVNEAHHQPLHRMFIASLLDSLHHLGYTYIGMETLSYDDPELMTRKYPVINSGAYSKEPCFGNLIRKAISLNYTVFPYEKKYKDEEQKGMNRELAEAINIKAMMDKNPEAKFVIYCGYDHVIEDSTHNFMVLPMAGQLKRLTGIDPFTIDQVELSEYNIVGNVYRKLIAIDSDAVFIDSAGNSFNKSRSLHKKVDCFVYHPNTSVYKYRPKWLVTANTKLVTLTEMINIEFPCLVKVYKEGEDTEHSVPFDIIELQHAGDRKTVLTNINGTAMIVVTNRKGQRQFFTLE